MDNREDYDFDWSKGVDEFDKTLDEKDMQMISVKEYSVAIPKKLPPWVALFIAKNEGELNEDTCRMLIGKIIGHDIVSEMNDDEVVSTLEDLSDVWGLHYDN